MRPKKIRFKHKMARRKGKCRSKGKTSHDEDRLAGSITGPVGVELSGLCIAVAVSPTLRWLDGADAPLPALCLI